MVRRFIAKVRKIGLRGAWELSRIEHATLRKKQGNGAWKIQVAGWQRPVHGRYGASDLDVFRQIFIEEEHSWIRSVAFRRRDLFILDCGANVGYASIFFLRYFPDALVIAVEPDDANFEILVRNLGGMGSRIKLVQAGLWSHKTKLAIDSREFRDGKEWSRQVKESSDSHGVSLQSVTVPEMIALAGRASIDLLKMDIEGAEAVVFADGGNNWLDVTDTIAIELHDDTHFGPATPAFKKAVSPDDFVFSTQGELTIAVRHHRCDPVEGDEFRSRNVG